ncbi:hypothetical protein LQF76_12525 [Gloeomargaritales cyanobacterium VI4D9]|nr:hypothetical protein LQF76_12525 [Gloeomargaritales cyanobacterium VI4D9]
MAEQFHRLTLGELKRLYQSGGLTSVAYLRLILQTKMRAGWKLTIESVDQFCGEWGLSKSTFYRARRKLQLEGFLSVQHTRLTLTCNTNSHQWHSSLTNENPILTGDTQDVTDENQTSLKPRAGAGSGVLLDVYQMSNRCLLEGTADFVSTNQADPSYLRFLGYKRRNPWKRVTGEAIERELETNPDPRIKFGWLKTAPSVLSPWWSVEFNPLAESPPGDPTSQGSGPHLGNELEQSPMGVGGNL